MENWKWNIKNSKLKIWDNPAMKSDTEEDFFTKILKNVFLRCEIIWRRPEGGTWKYNCTNSFLSIIKYPLACPDRILFFPNSNWRKSRIMPEDAALLPVTLVWRTYLAIPHRCLCRTRCTALGAAFCKCLLTTQSLGVFPFHRLLCQKSLPLYCSCLGDCLCCSKGRQILKYMLRKRGKCIETCTTAAVLSIQKNRITAANVEVAQCLISFKGLIRSHSSSDSNFIKTIQVPATCWIPTNEGHMKIKRPLWMDRSDTTVGQFPARSSWQLLPRTRGGGHLLIQLSSCGGFRQPARSSSKFTFTKYFCFFIHR